MRASIISEILLFFFLVAFQVEIRDVKSLARKGIMLLLVCNSFSVFLKSLKCFLVHQFISRLDHGGLEMSTRGIRFFRGSRFSDY